VSEVPSSTFMRYLREAMGNIGEQTARGVRGGVNDEMLPGGLAGRGSALGMLGGSIMGGGAAGYDATSDDDAMANAGMGAVAGGLGGGAAGFSAGAALGGMRGGARALRAALAQAIRESRQAERSPRPMPRQMAMIEQLQQLTEMRAQMSDDDPRAGQIDMAISAIRMQLSQLPA
jgi:hypothetical protein